MSTVYDIDELADLDERATAYRRLASLAAEHGLHALTIHAHKLACRYQVAADEARLAEAPL